VRTSCFYLAPNPILSGEDPKGSAVRKIKSTPLCPIPSVCGGVPQPGNPGHRTIQPIYHPCGTPGGPACWTPPLPRPHPRPHPVHRRPARARTSLHRAPARARPRGLGPGCNGFTFRLGACPSERGAAGTTAKQVKQSLIGAAIVLGVLITAGIAAGVVADAAAAAAPEEGSVIARALASCGESFTAGTKVLLASGLAVPIASLKPGDKILATNTKTGKTQAETAAAVLLNHDTDLYDLKVKTARGSAAIDTTRNHPFFDLTRHRWVKAGALKHGDHLRTSNGATAIVVSGRAPADTAGWMWDISVPGGNDHDFYIDTTVATVLVHNCPMMKGESRIARAMNLTKRQVADAIHAVKNQGGWRGLGANRNPDVFVDTDSGEVYPQLPGGDPVDDSIGNILDYLGGE
jgi:hypothetical protein